MADGIGALARTAARLGRAAGRRKPGARRLPHLYFLTDPARTPHPARVMRLLPRGAAVIYRAFGRADLLEQAAALRALARARGLVFLVGADARLAARLRADGVHLPERLMRLAPALRRRRPTWLITVAAHDQRAVARAARLGLDAALVSVVFPSRSPSAGRAMGPLRFAARARGAGLPVIALGGVDARTAPRLLGTGAHGLAAIGGFAEA
ncbi:MAG TPA: thiamine phosphate synthase [Caulobacteraceae bacterium]|nr:thiamine phosphate synthase [Caulobacteraceae bacterium]